MPKIGGLTDKHGILPEENRGPAWERDSTIDSQPSVQPVESELVENFLRNRYKFILDDEDKALLEDFEEGLDPMGFLFSGVYPKSDRDHDEIIGRLRALLELPILTEKQRHGIDVNLKVLRETRMDQWREEMRRFYSKPSQMLDL